MSDKEKIEENDSLILAWDQYIQGQAELIENIRPEFQKVIQTYFMKNNKKVKDYLLNSSSSIFNLVDIKKFEKLLKNKYFPNHMSKFIFNFLSAKIFLESNP